MSEGVYKGGHLSAFYINGESYERFTDSSDFWGKPPKSMNLQLKKVIEKGMNIGYESDFGSSTGLKIYNYGRGK